MQRKNELTFSALLMIVVASLTSAVGCSHTIDPAKIAPPYKVTVYERGEYSPERVFTSDSLEAKQIADWIEAHRTGWSHSLHTYAPARLIRGEDFDLNFGQTLCILNYRGGLGGRWTQVTRPIRKGDEPAVFGRRGEQ